MSDDAKAVEEVAKATGKAIDATRELGGFVSKYVGGTLEQGMGIVEDRLKYLRWERQIRLAERANDFLRERGLAGPTRHVPLRIAIPLLQAGSLEEDDCLQDRWAALLVNAADAATHVEVRRAFVSILEDLTPLDAMALEKIYALDQGADLDKEVFTTYLPDRVTVDRPGGENLNPPADVQVALGNLSRLGLITTAMTWGGTAIFSCVYRTFLGCDFLRAVSRSRDGV